MFYADCPCGFFKRLFTEALHFGFLLGLIDFPEDLDLFGREKWEFNLASYFPVLQQEVKSFGLNVTIIEKEKTKESNIQSAFLKGNTREHLLLFSAGEGIANSVAQNETIKIKFEVDVNPPAYAGFEHKYRLMPLPYEVNMYDLPSLFAGKIHAVICRTWQNQSKAETYMTIFFYLSKGRPLIKNT